MSKDKYIDKVLSHIKSKKRKDEIELELFDHIDEHEKFYIDIGYDKEKATHNADSKMGDADIVGEQLGAIGNHNNLSHTIFAVLSAIASLVFVILFQISTKDKIASMLSSNLNGINFNFTINLTNFVIYLIYTMLLILALINFLLALKSKKITNLCCGFISTLSLLIFKPYCLAETISNFLSGDSSAKKFYTENFWGTVFCTDITNTITKIIILITSLLISIIFIAKLSILIKTKMLKNTLKDLKINRVLTIITTIFMIFCIIVLASTIVKTISIKNDVTNNAIEKMETADKAFLNNYDKFFTTDKTELDNALKSTFQDGTYYNAVDGEIITDDMVVSASIDTSDYQYKTSIEIDNNLYSLFKIDEFVNLYESIDLDNLSINSSTKINDLPLPAHILFDYTENKCMLTFCYGYDEYGYEKNIVFLYNYDSNEFELFDSYFLTFDEHKESLTNNVSVYNSIYKDIYDISYNKDMDMYKIDLSYYEYSILQH